MIQKQHIDPNLMLWIHNGDNESNTIVIKNIEIVPAVEIYVKRRVYCYAKDAKEVYSVESERQGWHIKELAPIEVKTKTITPEDKEMIIGNVKIQARGRKYAD